MNTVAQRRPPVPSKYQEFPRLQVWYRHGYSQATRGFTPTENWLRCMKQDKAVSEAYYEGYRAGMLSK